MMRQPRFNSYLSLDGLDFQFDIFDDNFSSIDISKVSQSYGIIYNDAHEILLVHNQKHDLWGLPGGTIEEGEDPIACLHRECMEEAAITLDKQSIAPCFYQEMFTITDGKKEFLSYQVRYIAKVDSTKGFESDPDGSIDYISWFPIDKLEETLLWGKTTTFIISKLNKILP